MNSVTSQADRPFHNSELSKLWISQCYKAHENYKNVKKSVGLFILKEFEYFSVKSISALRNQEVMF